MEKEFLQYTESLALRELGFDEDCLGVWICKIKELHIGLDSLPYNNKNSKLKKVFEGDSNFISAPTYSQAFRWFEDNHQLYPAVVTDQTSYPKYAFEIASFFGNPKDLTEKEWGWNEMVLSRSLYRTKTEAELECLKKLIEIVKEK